MDNSNEDEIKRIIVDAKKIQNDILEYQKYDTEKAYNNVLRKRNLRANNSRIYNLFRAYSKIAAVLLLPFIGISLTLSYILIHNSAIEEKISWIEVSSTPGLVSHFQLPDSSWVWLNSGSKIKYPSRFAGNSRSVKLFGEALFDVSSDMRHPFYVELANGVSVMAHGTKFNITSYGNDSLIETTLLRGKVDIIKNNKFLAMVPNQKSIYNKNTGKIKLEDTDVEEAVDWKDSKILFRNSPLEDVMRKISRRHNVDIKFMNKSNRNYYIRANFTYENVAQILSYLQMIIPLEWNVEQKCSDNDAMRKTYCYNVWIK